MVSIAMTTYNGEKYLSQQIDSILNQTYDDFELVICDDCSSDGTRGILESYRKKDSRIKVYFNEQNLGFKKNFERAISFCTRDYIAFSDQDDVWNPEKIEISLSKIGSYDLVCSDVDVTDENLNSLGYTLKSTMFNFENFKETPELIKCMIHRNFVQGATILARKEFILKFFPIPENCLYHDMYYGMCALLGNGVKYIDTPTMKYRQHGTNVIGAKKKERFLSSLRPVPFEEEHIRKLSLHALCLVNVVRKSKYEDCLKTYLDDSERYYLALPSKEFSTLKYINKYYEYLFDFSSKKKKIVLIKRFLGIIRYKLFHRRKTSTL